MKLDSTKKLILDADVIIHFTKGGRINEIISIFPNPCVILDKVYHELRKLGMLTGIQPLIDSGRIEFIEITSDMTIFSEYASIIKHIAGRGESACLAYCKVKGSSLASSNVKDIHEYCDLNNIQ